MLILRLAVAILFLAFVFLVGFFVNKRPDATAAGSPPTVSAIAPDNGPIAGGTVITITGTGFKGEYERVEALVFDGNSYVNTGVTQRLHTINARFKMDTSNTSTANVVYGVNTTDTTARMAFAKAAGSSGAYTAYLGGGTNYSTTNGNALIRAGLRNDIAQDWATTYHVNGSQLANTGTLPSTNADILIGRDGILDANYRGEYYSLRTYSGTIMNHNFIPVKKVGEEVYGFIDTLEQPDPSSPGFTFYGNSGTGTLTGGTTVVDELGVSEFVIGATIPGGVSPDAPLEVLIDNRACTGVNIVSDTELTCHTPSGLSLGQKDLTVRVPVYYDSVNKEYVYESTTVTDGFEYALRLNSVYPKSGDPATTTDIEIDGGVFSTPPDQYESVEGIVFDGDSWIETGFNQVGSTKFIVNYRYASSVPNGPNVGFFGSRAGGTGSNSSFVVWSAVGGTSLRSDYNSNTGGTSYSISNMPATKSYTLVKDNNVTSIYDDSSTTGTAQWTQTTGSGLIANTSPAEMLLGSLSHGGAYGTNGATAYRSFFGTIYSAQICKDPTNTVAVPEGTVYQVDDSICGSGRVLVRDLRPAQRDTDKAYGFYDMVTGEFIANAGFGTFAASGTHVENALEVPLELNVTFSYLDEFSQEQTGVCASPELLTPTKVKCTMPISPLPGNTNGKVDLKILANGVEATPGTADADDFYYGSPMVVETISPNRGKIAGGQVVTISGNNFFPDDDDNDTDTYYDPSTYDPETSWDDIEILIGGSPCVFETSGGVLVDPSHYTNETLTCTTTANAGGISDVEVTSSYDYIDPIEGLTTIDKYYLYGGSLDPITGAITSGYLYEDDLISVSPVEGPTTGGTTVTIKGNNFLTSNTTTRVFFGNTIATNITVVDSNTITARTPPHSPGIVDILVSQDGYAASLDREALGAFEYTIGQSNISFAPSRGYIGGGDTIIITGTFDTNTTATVTFGGVASPSATVLSGTQLEVVIPARASAGRVDIVITQYGTVVGEATGNSGFNYINPLTITSISPNRGSTGGGTLVTITGESFVPADSTAAANLNNLNITFGGSPCTVDDVADYTDTSIKCTTSARSPGIVDVDITAGPSPNHYYSLPGVLGVNDSVESGYLYINASLSLSANSVAISLDVPGTPNYGSTTISVSTNNPAGYRLDIRADDSNGATPNDQNLKCTTSGLENATFQPVPSANSPLSAGTWGWGIGTGRPLTWNPITTSNTQLTSPISTPSSDTYTLWFGANAAWTQPSCSYVGKVIITMVPLQ